jgi:hypothetical protein
MDRWPTVPRNDRDVPYWYGERPLTGLLATAAWRIGGVAIEESAASPLGQFVRQGTVADSLAS